METEVDYRTLFNLCFRHSDGIFILLSKDFSIQGISSAAIKLLGWKRTQVLNKNIGVVFQETSVEPFIDIVQPRKQSRLITYVLCNDQNIKIIWNVTFLGKNKKDFDFILIVGKSTKNSLEGHLTSKQLENVVKYAPGFFYWKNRDSIYQWCNDEFASLAGLKSREEVKGKTDFDLAWKEHAESYVAVDKQVMETRQARSNQEETIPISSNAIITAITSKVPIVDDKNQVVGVLGITTDISERKHMEEELRVAKEDAEAANHAKTEFIANMSHDIRTPLTGILGLIQELIDIADDSHTFLQQKDLSPAGAFKDKLLVLLQQLVEKVQEDGQLLIGAADELLQLLNEILETMRLESGKASEQPESFDLRELVDHNIELMQPVAHHKKIKLLYEIDEQIPIYFSGLRHYLDRSLLNILSNALKFTDKGFVKIQVKLLSKNKENWQLGDNIQLKISIQDSGIGIPEDKLDTIFDHFSRLTPSYQGIYKGAGLGLYTVKHYIEAMKAEIQVESVVAKGTTFIIQLPLTVSDHSDREKNNYRLPKTTIRRKVTALPKVENVKKDGVGSLLIVEDNPLAAMAIQSNLRHLTDAVHIDIAANGMQAIKMVQEHDYDLVLMDIGLPDMEGTQVTQHIRALDNPKTAQIPIIAVTGHGDDLKKRNEALAIGMQDVFSKPLTISKLEELLQYYVFHNKHKEDSSVSPPINGINDLEVIDWEANIRNLNVDMDCVRKLISALSADLKITQEKLAKAYRTNDHETLRRELHKARGGIAYFVVPQLDKAFTQFHDSVKETPLNSELMAIAYVNLQHAMKNFWEVWERNK